MYIYSTIYYVEFFYFLRFVISMFGRYIYFAVMMIGGCFLLSGCGNGDREFDDIHKQFRSEYITNINNIKNTSYNISWYAVNEISGWYDQISGSLLGGYINVYKNGHGYIDTDCVDKWCGVLSLLGYDFGDLFMYDEVGGGLDLKLNKKLLTKTLSQNVVGKNYLISSLSADDIGRKGRYISNGGQANLSIEKLVIGSLNISGSIWSGLVALDISRGGNVIYIRDLSWSDLHIYSSGFMDIYISKID